MIIPPYIKPGDLVRIVSPAKLISPAESRQAIQTLKNEGFQIKLGKHVHGSWNRFSGTDSERLEDLQTALDDPECKAIFFSRGGYGSVRLVDKLNFDGFVKNPKWLIGFSDITVFHTHINRSYQIATCHGPMPLNMTKAETNTKSTHILLEVLKGNSHSLYAPSSSFNNTGAHTGELIGGNLSVFTSMVGTNSFPETRNRILFLEDLCEELYHLDRMMYQLKKAGVFDQLGGVVFGSFTDMTDVSGWFKQDVLEILHQHTHELEIPVGYGFPAGHQADNQAMFFGLPYDLEVSGEGSILKQKSLSR